VDRPDGRASGYRGLEQGVKQHRDGVAGGATQICRYQVGLAITVDVRGGYPNRKAPDVKGLLTGEAGRARAGSGGVHQHRYAVA